MPREIIVVFTVLILIVSAGILFWRSASSPALSPSPSTPTVTPLPSPIPTIAKEDIMPSFLGIVASVSRDSISVRGENETKTFSLTVDTRVERVVFAQGKPQGIEAATIADLAEGQKVTVVAQEGTPAAQTILIIER